MVVAVVVVVVVVVGVGGGGMVKTEMVSRKKEKKIFLPENFQT